MQKSESSAVVIVPQNVIENKIYFIRGKRVMLDYDLAHLYGVPTKRLNEQVKRNKKRLPDDFMFQLSITELRELVANCDQLNRLKHSSNPPYVFTEQGVAMLSSVLNSERAIDVNIQIMRVFSGVKRLLLTHADLRRKIEAMEKKYDLQFKQVFAVIKKLLEPPPEPLPKPRKPIGFSAE